ncbi:tRNA uridine-5-carboxymethylaminomethyl(34) synthesis GTPase MnmE [Celerinatantimonas sp. MCCC 1A17872]|uniref:tRNA uridine-5-carboxymethylaminomethyl(34) synthesis GTPase MnmE n=1 Tax=Celerinatantimonas sp. MCCC 1A17872 TaxID=3177514 RepID=UPI0038C510E4
MQSIDTIVAQATAPGRGGVGIVRVSGPKAQVVAKAMLGHCPKPRYAEYVPFKNADGDMIDQGIALFFKGPHSYTGEDILELQGHGGPVVMDLLIQQILKLDDIRTARPGEFTERAFLNDKIDLAQAEAIADLIEATSAQAAKSALNSMQGQFSKQVSALVEQLIHLRIFVEAAIDFPEEEVDFLGDGKIAAELSLVEQALTGVRAQAGQGALLREGMKVVIAGRPNAGKSSLLNALAGKDSAIVTDIAGTTRDVLREYIHLDGMPLHIIDTAGLRDSPDKVEQIGIARAWDEINNADRVLLMVDSSESDAKDPTNIWPEFMARLPEHMGLSVVRNKADQSGETIGMAHVGEIPVLSLSAKTGEGIELLREHLKDCMGFQGSNEGTFMARRRHLDALDKAFEHLENAHVQLEEYKAGELVAEELRLCQNALSEITGEFTSDDLLGRIFSSFCIGK